VTCYGVQGITKSQQRRRAALQGNAGKELRGQRNLYRSGDQTQGVRREAERCVVPRPRQEPLNQTSESSGERIHNDLNEVRRQLNPNLIPDLKHRFFNWSRSGLGCRPSQSNRPGKPSSKYRGSRAKAMLV